MQFLCLNVKIRWGKRIHFKKKKVILTRVYFQLRPRCSSTADTPLLSFAIKEHVSVERLEGRGERRYVNEGRYLIPRLTSSLQSAPRCCSAAKVRLSLQSALYSCKSVLADCKYTQPHKRV